MTFQFSIKAALDQHAFSLEKNWSHDRTATIGASEIGQCARKTAFSKAAQKPDPEYRDRWGAKKRGDLYEAFWEAALQRYVAQIPGAQLLFSGAEQRTLVSGYISATPDGLMHGVSRDILAHAGVPDIEADCLVLECKSIDPRVTLRTAKEEHMAQVQQQMGLIRECTAYKPMWAIVSYMDASFPDDISEWIIRFDQGMYDRAKKRAEEIINCTDPLTMRPEGKMAGGAECNYCPYVSKCAAVQQMGIPKEETGEIGDNAIARLDEIVRRYDQSSQDAKAAESHKQVAAEEIKEFLREIGTRKVSTDEWDVSYSGVKGRRTLSKELLKAEGLDPERFMSEGTPSERLSINLKN